MAKKSKIVREHKLIKKVQKYAALRAELKVIIEVKNLHQMKSKLAVARLDNYQNHPAIFVLEIVF